LADRLFALPSSHATRDLVTIEQYYREALVCYQESQRPISMAYIQRSLASVLLEQGHSAAALEPLHAAMQGLRESAYEPHQRDAAWAYSAYADALTKLDRMEEALSAYAEAIEIQPDLTPLYRNRAETLIALRRLAEAEADLEQAVTVDGHEDSPYLWYRRAQL